MEVRAALTPCCACNIPTWTDQEHLTRSTLKSQCTQAVIYISIEVKKGVPQLTGLGFDASAARERPLCELSVRNARGLPRSHARAVQNCLAIARCPETRKQFQNFEKGCCTYWGDRRSELSGLLTGPLSATFKHDPVPTPSCNCQYMSKRPHTRSNDDGDGMANKTQKSSANGHSSLQSWQHEPPYVREDSDNKRDVLYRGQWRYDDRTQTTCRESFQQSHAQASQWIYICAPLQGTATARRSSTSSMQSPRR